jgi:hypothetical protein
LIEHLPLGYEWSGDPALRQVAVITAPEIAASVMVRIGRFTAYLPLPNDRGFWEEFEPRMTEAFRIAGDPVDGFATVSLASYGWPIKPMHLWDEAG